MVELDAVITQRNVMAIWKKLAEGFDSLDDGGSGNVSMVSSSSINVEPMVPATSTVVVRIPRTISQLFEQARQSNASVGKEDASVEKADASVGKATVVALKPSLLYLDEEFFGPCPIVEEMQDTQDPAVTINSANP